MKTKKLKTHNWITALMCASLIIWGVTTTQGQHHVSSGIFKHTYKLTDTADSNIVGTWILATDSTSKIVFADAHNCQRFNSGTLFETDSVILSNTSPQCGITVPVTVNTTYMQWINKANSANHYCFEITGISNAALAIRMVSGGPILQYYRP